MPGRWIARAIQPLLREETFDRLVSPAVADLQLEARSCRTHGWRHYPALAFVVSVAFLRDIRLDAVAFLSEPGRAWMRASVWCLGFTALVATLIVHNTPLHLMGTSGQLAGLVSAILNGFIDTLPLSIAAIVFYVRRQRRLTVRAWATLFALCITTGIVIELASIPAGSTLNQMMYGSVSPRISREAVLPDTPEQHDLAEEWRSWSMWRSDLNNRPFPWSDFGRSATGFVLGLVAFVEFHMTQLLTFALFGVVLARGRGITVLVRVLALALLALMARPVLLYIALDVAYRARDLPYTALGDRMLAITMTWAVGPTLLSLARRHVRAMKPAQTPR